MRHDRKDLAGPLGVRLAPARLLGMLTAALRDAGFVHLHDLICRISREATPPFKHQAKGETAG